MHIMSSPKTSIYTTECNRYSFKLLQRGRNSGINKVAVLNENPKDYRYVSQTKSELTAWQN